MSIKQNAMAFIAAVLVTLFTGCAHQLTVLNLGDYHVSGLTNLPPTTTLGVQADSGDKTIALLIDGVAKGLKSSGAQVVYPYYPAGVNTADMVAKIAIKTEFKGSGTNFWINFPGFLVWAPAWNGYVYKANFDIHVDLVKGSDLNTVVKAFDLPVHLDIRHAEIDRTWCEVSWFEVGSIALVTGFIYMRYDTDVTAPLMVAIEQPIGEYVAKKILMNVASP